MARKRKIVEAPGDEMSGSLWRLWCGVCREWSAGSWGGGACIFLAKVSG